MHKICAPKRRTTTSDTNLKCRLELWLGRSSPPLSNRSFLAQFLDQYTSHLGYHLPRLPACYHRWSVGTGLGEPPTWNRCPPRETRLFVSSFPCRSMSGGYQSGPRRRTSCRPRKNMILLFYVPKQGQADGMYNTLSLLLHLSGPP